MAAARQAKGGSVQSNGVAKGPSAAPKVESLASRAAALNATRQIRPGGAMAPHVSATLAARAASVVVPSINKVMGNVSPEVLAQAAARQRIQANMPVLTEPQKAEGHSVAVHAVSTLEAITAPVCEKGCTNEQSNAVLAVQIQMQTSGNPLVAPADSRQDSFHRMPWKNNSGLHHSGRSRAVADFTENLEDVNLMGSLNLFIIP